MTIGRGGASLLRYAADSTLSIPRDRSFVDRSFPHIKPGATVRGHEPIRISPHPSLDGPYGPLTRYLSLIHNSLSVIQSVMLTTDVLSA